jgi:hypothetical protein
MAAKGYGSLRQPARLDQRSDFRNIIQYHYPGDDYRDLMIKWMNF